MDQSKQTSNVILFPLCDVRGAITETLCKTENTVGTRVDALMFAWRLDLPKGISVGQAANAILAVALSKPRDHWTRDQLLLVKALMSLGDRETLITARGQLPTAESFADRVARLSTVPKTDATLPPIKSDGNQVQGQARKDAASLQQGWQHVLGGGRGKVRGNAQSDRRRKVRENQEAGRRQADSVQNCSEQLNSQETPNQQEVLREAFKLSSRTFFGQSSHQERGLYKDSKKLERLTAALGFPPDVLRQEAKSEDRQLGHTELDQRRSHQVNSNENQSHEVARSNNKRKAEWWRLVGSDRSEKELIRED